MESDGWNFNGSGANEIILRSLCEQAEMHFQLSTKVYRYFAARDDDYLRNENGLYYRGFTCPIYERGWLPPYLTQCFFHSLDGSFRNFDEMVAFEHLIYIRASTCSDPTGCVTTYAHELQHVIQHESSPRLLRINQDLYRNIKKFDSSATASDIPHEREANIVSKKVAEAVCGVGAVRIFAEKQVALMQELGNIEQLDRWRFFRDVSSSTAYDLLASTLPFIKQYKKVINFGVDIDKPEWWLGPLDDSS